MTYNPERRAFKWQLHHIPPAVDDDGLAGDVFVQRQHHVPPANWPTAGMDLMWCAMTPNNYSTNIRSHIKSCKSNMLCVCCEKFVIAVIFPSTSGNLHPALRWPQQPATGSEAAGAAAGRDNQARTSITELSVPCRFQTFSWASKSGIHSPSRTNLYS